MVDQPSLGVPSDDMLRIIWPAVLILDQRRKEGVRSQWHRYFGAWYWHTWSGYDLYPLPLGFSKAHTDMEFKPPQYRTHVPTSWDAQR